MNKKEQSILFVTCANPEEGAPHQVMAAIMLAQSGYKILCMCAGTGFRGVVNTPVHSLPVYSIKRGIGKLASIKWQLMLFINLLKLRYRDNFQSFYIHGSVVTPACYFALIGINKKFVIYHTQDYLEPGKHAIWEFFEKKVARCADVVFSNECNRARFMASFYQLKEVPKIIRTSLPHKWPVPGRDEVLRNEILKSIGRDGCKKTRLVLHQGSFSEVRCTGQLIQAMTKLPEEFVLVFTGVNKLHPSFVVWHEKISSSFLESRVIYLDYMPFNILLKYTAVCDIGILLYPDDGVGNYYQSPGRLTEYLRCGLPMVTSDFPGLELLVLKYGLGKICNPTDPDDIAEAIYEVAKSLVDKQENVRSRLIDLACNEFAYESQFLVIKNIIDEGLGCVEK